MRRLAIIATAALAVALPGCEFGQKLQSSRSVAHGILKVVEPRCAPYGGIGNIMLMEGREDDGIVSCKDGRHNFYFDA